MMMFVELTLTSGDKVFLHKHMVESIQSDGSAFDQAEKKPVPASKITMFSKVAWSVVGTPEEIAKLIDR
jgi:hypothetical protein